MSDKDERVSETDRQLIVRMQTRLAAAQELQAFISMHLGQVYGLRGGDRVDDDGRIVRAEGDDAGS